MILKKLNFILGAALFLGAFCGFGITLAHAGSATVFWNPNGESDLAGYKIYYGTSPRTGSCPTGGYPSSVNVGNTTSYVFNNLTDGLTYYFSVTAYDTANPANESCFSSEVSKFIQPTQTVPLAPSNLTASAISSSQINLLWTDNSSNETGFQIERKTGVGGTYTNIATTTANVTSYSNTGLTPNTTYYYRVRAYNAAGSSGYSNEANATTQGSDTTAPVRSNGQPTGILPAGTTQTTLSLTTDENATCKYGTVANTSYASLPNTFSTTGGTSHSTTIAGLVNGGSYTYYIRCQDTAGNPNTSDFTISFSVASSGTTITVDSTYGGYATTPIDDGVINASGGVATTWASGESSVNAHWVQHVFSASQTFSRATIWWAWNALQGKYMTSQQVQVQYWNGSAWVTAGTMTYPGSDVASSSVSFASISATQWRLNQPAAQGNPTYNTIMWLTEVDYDTAPADTTSPTGVGNSSPANGATGVSVTPTLTALTASDASTPISYYFELYQGASCSGTPAQTRSYSTATTWNPATLQSATTYAWRNKAKDNVGNESAFGTCTTFTTVAGSDTTFPTVSITAPSGGAIVGGTITVSAAASDNVGVVGVQFKLDGVNLGTEDTVSPYSMSWDTTTAPNGPHTLTAVARDAANNQTTSASVTVTVSNTQTLSVAIAANPSSGTTPLNGVDLAATVSGTAQGTMNYTFYCDRSDSGTNITTPYDWKVNGTSTNPYTIADLCSYPNPGTYTGKVIVERGVYAAESRVTITVSSETTPPSVPTGLSAIANSPYQVTLTWLPSTDTGGSGLAGYKVFRSVAGSAYVQIGTVTATTYVDSALSPNTLYSYVVQSYDNAGNASVSSIVSSATTPAETLFASITASPSSGNAPVASTLTATVSGNAEGTITYTFYCNRADSGTRITLPYDAQFSGETATTKTYICTYTTSGTYTPKVIVQRMSSLRAESRASVIVDPISSSDTISPSVSITSPVNGVAVSGSAVLIAASASDNIGVTGVQFKIDGANLGDEDLTAPYEVVWDTTAASNAVHFITATARDAAGNISTSPTVSVTVNNAVIISQPPPPPPASSGGGGGGAGGYTPSTPTTPTTPTTPSSQPTLILTKNLFYSIRDNEVQLLQQHLKLLGYFTYPEFTTFFGNATKAAVIAYQQAKGISPAAGYVGPLTRAALAGGATPTAPSTPTSSGIVTRSLVQGMSGTDVTALQEKLRSFGFFPVDTPTTQYFGSVTLYAVQQFQCLRLSPPICSGTPETTGYGVVGPKTKAALGL